MSVPADRHTIYGQQSRLNHHVTFGLHDDAHDAGLWGIHVGDRGIHTDTDVSQQERHYDSVSDCTHVHPCLFVYVCIICSNNNPVNQF